MFDWGVLKMPSPGIGMVSDGRPLDLDVFHTDPSVILTHVYD